jgi:hypothetical protein
MPQNQAEAFVQRLVKAALCLTAFFVKSYNFHISSPLLYFFMNIQSVANLHKMSLHILVERAESGYFTASVPELANCIAEAKTREAAIASVRDKVKARLANIEVLTLEVANNPWMEFIGMFEGDDEFAELATELLVEREPDTNDTI